ncbi:VirB4 family type IV secretion system protein [Deinococcus multiflagellatus]|uniref:VirB4 family type IV secretion system protein n=1 Tax=Deinococcus multiflagellatus TaxID=1656887 RepID=A0ABW1ZSB5_9DEIO
MRLFPLSPGRVAFDDRVGYRQRLHRAIIGTLPTGSRIRTYTVSSQAGPDSVQRFLTHGGHTENVLLRQLCLSRDERIETLQRRDMLSDVRTFLTVSIPGLPKVKNAPYLDSVMKDLIPDILDLRQDLSHQIYSAGIYNIELQTAGVFREIYGYFNKSIAPAGMPTYSSVLDQRRLEDLDDHTLFSNSIREQVACTSLDHSNDGYLVMDNRFITTVSMWKAGEGTDPGITEKVLTALAGRDYVLMNEFLIEDPADQRAKINEQLDTMTYEAEALGAGRETTQRIASGQDVLSQLESGEVTGRWASALILSAEDPKALHRLKLDAVGVYRQLEGITPIVGDAQNLDIFLDCAPFNGAQHPYHSKAYGSNAIDFIPLVGSWSGKMRPLLTLRNAFGGLTGINPTEGVSKYGVIVVAGPGAGKTHLVHTVLSAAAAVDNARTITIDMKDGYIPLYELLGGSDGKASTILEFGPGATTSDGRPLCVNLFDLPPEHAQPQPDKFATILQVLRLLKIVTNPTRETLARNAVEQFYSFYSEPIPVALQEDYLKAYEDERQLLAELHMPELREAPTTRYTNEGTLSDFHRILRNMNQLKTEGIRPEVKQEQLAMAMELEPYLNAPGGLTTDIGRFLDGQTNATLTADHTYIRAGRMDSDPIIKSIGLLLINELIWNTARNNPDGRWTYVNNEEVGALCMMEGGRDQVRRQYKLGREFGLVPIAVTQEPADIEALSGLSNGASTFLFGELSADEIEKTVRAFNLTPAVAEQIRNLGGKLGVYREFVAVNAGENSQIDAIRGALYTSELEMMLFSSHKDDKARRDQMRRQLGNGSHLEASLAMLDKGA